MQTTARRLCAPVLALALISTASSCDPAVPAGAVTGDCSSENLYKGDEDYFTGTMVPQIFEPYCAYCHWSDKADAERKGAPTGLNYDNFEDARSRNVTAEQVPGFGTWVRMADRTMPPMGRVPSTEELQMVLDWINCEIARNPRGDDDDSAGDDDSSR